MLLFVNCFCSKCYW